MSFVEKTCILTIPLFVAEARGLEQGGVGAKRVER